MAVPDVAAKPLPPPAKDEKLPSIPPLDFDDRVLPATPPKIVHDPAPDVPPTHKPLPPIDVKASLGTSDLCAYPLFSCHASRLDCTVIPKLSVLLPSRP